jgi:hypothetical protein
VSSVPTISNSKSNHDFCRHTEPEAFFLEVFFNAGAIVQADSKEKQRAANALIPTVIAYAGGQVDFSVDMGTEVRILSLPGTNSS